MSSGWCGLLEFWVGRARSAGLRLVGTSFNPATLLRWCRAPFLRNRNVLTLPSPSGKLYAAYGSTLAWRLAYRLALGLWPCSARHAAEHSGFACRAHVLRCALTRWLKASLLEPCAFLGGLRTVCYANSEAIPRTVACDRKAVKHAFPSLFGSVRHLTVPHLPLVLLPHEGWCWVQRSGRNRSGEALALAFAPGFQPLRV